MKNTLFLIMLIATGTFYSCNTNEFKAKSTEIPPIKIQHLEEDLSKTTFKDVAKDQAFLEKKYPILFPFYVEKLMGIGSFDSTTDVYYAPYFENFLEGEHKALKDSVGKVFPNFDTEEKMLTEAFGHYKYYFPSRTIPTIYSMIISPMGAATPPAFTIDSSIVGINLFCYLGKNFSFYDDFYDNYMKTWLQKNYVTRNVMLTIYELYNPQKETSDALLFEMIQMGKRMYYLDCITPETADENKIGYTKEQLEWCIKNEEQIWKFLVENKLLYSNKVLDIKRYTMEGPATPGMPKEAPGMVGTWIGWQIVKKYMKEKGNNVSLQDLLYKIDTKTIWNEAKYKAGK